MKVFQPPPGVREVLRLGRKLGLDTLEGKNEGGKRS